MSDNKVLSKTQKRATTAFLTFLEFNCCSDRVAHRTFPGS
jgi:hypothetical protein